MSTCTPIYGLDYPRGSDPPCDVGDTFCTFAEQVDALLTGLRDSVSRVTRIPMAKISTLARVTSNAIVFQETIPFDTEEIDTLDMVDLSTDQFSITIPFAGLYWNPSFVEWTWTTSVIQDVFGRVFGSFASGQGTTQATSSGSGGITSATVVPISTPHPSPIWAAGDTIQLADSWDSGNAATRVTAQNTVYWFSDI